MPTTNQVVIFSVGETTIAVGLALKIKQLLTLASADEAVNIKFAADDADRTDADDNKAIEDWEVANGFKKTPNV